jgi:hypothetical protein
VCALNSLLSRHRQVKTKWPGVHGTSKIARIEFPRTLAYTLVAFFVLLYTVVYVNAPILIWSMGDHDDGLDMALGRHISQGEWLGPYNQLTLLKGPGYAVFLAVVSWLGISVSLAHALFHCAAVALFFVVCRRFIRSALLSSLMFAFLLWHPIALTAPMLRVSRSTVYHGQVLIFLAFAAYALFGIRDHKRGAFFGCLSGAVLA